MEKIFKLTLDLKATINDELQGLGTWESLQYTRQFLEEVKGDKDILLEFYEYYVYSYLADLFTCKDLEQKLNEKTESDILISVLPKLPSETARYISRVFNPDQDLDIETCDRNSSLIYDQFNPPEITGIHFQEIEPGEDKKK